MTNFEYLTLYFSFVTLTWDILHTGDFKKVTKFEDNLSRTANARCEQVYFQYLTLAFGPLTFTWIIILHTVKSLLLYVVTPYKTAQAQRHCYLSIPRYNRFQPPLVPIIFIVVQPN